MITQEQKDRIQEETVKYETAHNFEGVYHAYRTAATHERELANQELKTIEKHNADLLDRIKEDEKTIANLNQIINIWERADNQTYSPTSILTDAQMKVISELKTKSNKQ